MFGDLMGNLQNAQQQMKDELSVLEISAEVGGIAVVVTGEKKVTNIKIDPALVAENDAEQLEDLLLEAINRAMDKADVEIGAKMQNMMGGMMPPGLFG